MEGAPPSPQVPGRGNDAPRPDAAPECAGGTGGAGGRLNLLLSYAGWHADSWADRLPVLLEPMGVRALRVTTGRQASQVIRQTAIHIAVVDLGLPLDECGATALKPGPAPSTAAAEEAGPRLLELLSRLSQPPPILVIKRSRSHRDDSREIAAALRANAFAVLDRPRDTSDVELLLETLRRCLLRHYRGRWPGLS